MRISDWSSDVCSSDLEFQASMERKGRRYARRRAMLEWTDRASVHDALVEGIKSVAKSQSIDFDHIAIKGLSDGARSEERRVGNDCVSTCKSRWCAYPLKIKYIIQ